MNEARMLSCHEVVAQLWDYIDSELTPERAEQIREHLEVCQRCYPQYDFQRAFLKFLRAQEHRPAPPELRHRVFEALLAETAAG